MKTSSKEGRKKEKHRKDGSNSTPGSSGGRKKEKKDRKSKKSAKSSRQKKNDAEDIIAEEETSVVEEIDARKSAWKPKYLESQTVSKKLSSKENKELKTLLGGRLELAILSETMKTSLDQLEKEKIDLEEEVEKYKA